MSLAKSLLMIFDFKENNLTCSNFGKTLLGGARTYA